MSSSLISQKSLLWVNDILKIAVTTSDLHLKICNYKTQGWISSLCYFTNLLINNDKRCATNNDMRKR